MSKKITKAISRYPYLVKLPVHASVTTATKLMTEHNVGAIMVTSNERLVGIFTERDVVKRVVALGLSPDQTTLGQVMTADPITLQPGELISNALEVMNKNHIRHLPLEENGELLGMVSIRDLFAAVNADLQDNISTKDALIFGEAYGATSKAA